MNMNFMPREKDAGVIIIGIDKGTSETKTSEDVRFRSTVKPYTENAVTDKDALVVEYKGEKYYIGEKSGKSASDLEKAEQDYTDLLILTGIALSYEDKEVIECEVVTGLPIQLYQRQKEKMEKLFEIGKIIPIRVNGKDHYIRIHRLTVFPESAGAFFSQNELSSCIVVDIGGLSVDVSEFEDKKLINFSTYKLGTMPLLQDIANVLNAEYDQKISKWDVPDKLGEGILDRGKHIMNFPDADKKIKTYADKIIEALNLEYNLRGYQILMVGGGALFFKEYFNQDKNTAHAKLLTNPDPVLANAYGYRNIGRSLRKND